MVTSRGWLGTEYRCGRIRRDIRIYEEERDPQVHDSLVLKTDPPLHHLLGLGAWEDVVKECANALSMLCDSILKEKSTYLQSDL